MSDLNLLYTDVEDDLRSSVRDLVAARSEPATVAAVYDGDRSVVDPLWRAIAGDLGLAGLLIPEERGGAGASAREAAVVLEELGRSVAPVPFFTSSVVATTVLLTAEPASAPRHWSCRWRPGPGTRPRPSPSTPTGASPAARAASPVRSRPTSCWCRSAPPAAPPCTRCRPRTRGSSRWSPST